MIRTRVCDPLEIDYPIALGGMGGGHTQPDLVAAVSEAGGLDEHPAVMAFACPKRDQNLKSYFDRAHHAGLIRDIPSAGELIRRMAEEAEEILSSRLPGLLQ